MKAMYSKTKSSVSSPYQILVKIDEVKHSIRSLSAHLVQEAERKQKKKAAAAGEGGLLSNLWRKGERSRGNDSLRITVLVVAVLCTNAFGSL